MWKNQTNSRSFEQNLSRTRVSYSKYRTILQSDLQHIKITIKHLENKVEKAENRFKNRQAQEKGILITPYKYSFYSYDSLSVNVPAL